MSFPTFYTDVHIILYYKVFRSIYPKIKTNVKQNDVILDKQKINSAYSVRLFCIDLNPSQNDASSV